MGDARVLVVGSINEDVYLDVDRLPHAGETVSITRVSRGTGGKGANQASAAAHAGASVVLVGAVGSDGAGQRALENLRSVGVDITSVELLDGHATGTAWVFRGADGDNLIGIQPGANYAVGAPGEPLFAGQPTVLCQGEVRPELILEVAAAATQHDCRFVLNLAPIIALAPSAVAIADPLVLNEHEAFELAAVVGHERTCDLQKTLEVLARRARSVVVTLGARGALSVVAGQRPVKYPADAVSRVVDTTGAGDAFVGGLVAALAGGAALEEAVREGGAIASRKVSLSGAFIKGL